MVVIMSLLAFGACTLLDKLMPEVAPPVYGGDIKLGDGELLAKRFYIYKCKICDMPRIFKMDYISSLGR